MAIVAATLALFVWKGLRRSKTDFHKQTGCGCDGAPKVNFVVTGRKGERPTVMMKD